MTVFNVGFFMMTAVIGYLLEGEDEEMQCISSPDSYLQKYQTPYDVTLQAGQYNTFSLH